MPTPSETPSREENPHLLVKVMRVLWRGLPKVIENGWPILLVLAMRYEQVHTLLWVLLVSLILSWLSTLGAPFSWRRTINYVLSITLCLLSLFTDNIKWMFWYPVIVNIGFFVVFSRSLEGEAACTKFAMIPHRIKNPEATPEESLPPEAIRYTRGLTKAWCSFFVLNGFIALATTLYGDVKVWWLWNGCLSYLVIGAFFAVESLYRRWKISHA